MCFDAGRSIEVHFGSKITLAGTWVQETKRGGGERRRGSKRGEEGKKKRGQKRKRRRGRKKKQFNGLLEKILGQPQFLLCSICIPPVVFGCN